MKPERPHTNRKTRIIIGVSVVIGVVGGGLFGLNWLSSDIMVDIPHCFFIQGRVYDTQTKQPLKHVKVIFVLTGFGRKPGFVQEVGESEQNGHIDVTYHFVQGLMTNPLNTLLGNDPKKTFALIVFKESYLGEWFSFDANELPKRGICYEVNLQDIHLPPDPNTASKEDGV